MPCEYGGQYATHNLYCPNYEPPKAFHYCSICSEGIYNGEKYIEAQLESIKKQSLLPDLVLIADDCSSYKTVHIIEEYIKNNTLLNWNLEFWRN